MLTDHSDKNGTTKETREEDLKRKEKLPKKIDLLNYLNVCHISFECKSKYIITNTNYLVLGEIRLSVVSLHDLAVLFEIFLIALEIGFVLLKFEGLTQILTVVLESYYSFIWLGFLVIFLQLFLNLSLLFECLQKLFTKKLDKSYMFFFKLLVFFDFNFLLFSNSLRSLCLLKYINPSESSFFLT